LGFAFLFLTKKNNIMPQFDAAAFLPQVFWIAVIFLGFYFFCVGHSLPFVARALKARHKYRPNVSSVVESCKSLPTWPR